jgi:hypothetical protein
MMEVRAVVAQVLQNEGQQACQKEAAEQGVGLPWVRTHTHASECGRMSPQHLSQEHRRNKTDTMKLGTRVIIGDEEVQLQWGDRQFIKTIKLSKANNIPIMQSAPGFH